MPLLYFFAFRIRRLAAFERFYKQFKDSNDDLITNKPFQDQDYRIRSETTASTLFLFQLSSNVLMHLSQHPRDLNSKGNITISLEKCIFEGASVVDQK